MCVDVNINLVWVQEISLGKLFLMRVDVNTNLVWVQEISLGKLFLMCVDVDTNLVWVQEISLGELTLMCVDVDTNLVWVQEISLGELTLMCVDVDTNLVWVQEISLGELTLMCLDTNPPLLPFFAQKLKQPRRRPSEEAYAGVQVTIYSLMGYASYLVWRDGGGFKGVAFTALTWYGFQLAVDWAWAPIFYGLHS